MTHRWGLQVQVPSLEPGSYLGFPPLNTSEKSPTADVYAGDTSSLDAVEASNGSIHFFEIEADSEPGTFARIANVLNIANIAPKRVMLEVKEADGSLSIYIELRAALNVAQSIQRKLTQLTDVMQVNIGKLPAGTLGT
jgi:hypothetical protein